MRHVTQLYYTHVMLQCLLHSRQVGEVAGRNLVFPLDLGVDVSEVVYQLFLARVFAEHRRHFFPQMTYDVRMHLEQNGNN